MRSLTLFTNKKDHKQAAIDLIEKARISLDFKPDLVLFYATLKYNGKYQPMLDILHEEFGDIPQIGASVDGMIYPDDMRTDGAALVLCNDENSRICVEGVREKGSIRSAKKLAKKIKCDKGAIVLHFPLVHVPDMLKSADFFAKGFYYSQRCHGASPDKQRKFAGKFSEYCDKKNIFYLPPTILNIFSECTDHKVPIIGINVMHSQVRFNSPNIFCNFKDIGDGISALVIEKDDINAIYDDIFPDKGKTLEETKDIINKEFKVIKEFKASFEKNILISLDGQSPVEAVKNLIFISSQEKEELLQYIDKGDYKAHRPYGLLFFNERTKGAFLLGMGSYVPFDLFPFFMDVSDYSPDVSLAYMLIDDKFDGFISCLNNLKSNNNNFVYFSVDMGVAAAFGSKIFEFKDKIIERVGDNYFGILAPNPSAYIPVEYRLRENIAESSDNTFFMSAGSNACLEI